MYKLNKYIFAGFSFCLPINTQISNIFIIVLAIVFFIEFFLSKEKKINFNVILYSLIPVFILVSISLFWSNNTERGIILVGRLISILLIPLVFSLTNKKNHGLYLKYSFYGLVMGSLTVSIVLIVNKIFLITSSLEEVTIPLIFSSQYTSFQYTLPLLDIDPSYLGLYSLISLAIIFFYKLPVTRFINSLATLFLLINIVFLNSRIIFLLLVFLIGLKIFETLAVKLRFVAFAFFLLFSALTLYLIKDTYIYKKMVTGTLWELSYNINNHNTTSEIKSDSRMARWSSAIEASKEHSLFGHGIGMENDVLFPVYKTNNLITSLKNKFNTHNQYLSFLLTIGFIGIVLFSLFFWLNFYLSYQKKDFLMFFFFLSIFLLCFVENIFSRNAGIIFLAMYVSLFNKQYLST